ncbi:kDa in NOF-FB transposable element [Paramuricea clavata]|uniref:ubiquitinyl hydrolase 1 n=1 Tax=Paramuricea clavata TaxID=317549 RepID=A0A7D9HC31_PARCT|nr:kDa in NOF-FB transposable element [Paramuricea clavata]
MRDSVFPCGAESDSTHELCDTNDKNVVPSCKPSTTLAEESECSEQESDTELLCSNDSEGSTDNSRTNVEKPDDYVYDVAIDQCQCYSSLKEDENENFFRTPHLLSTVNALSNSNIPSSGTFQAKLIRSVSYVRMSSEWLNIPVKSGKVSARTSFTGNYTTFFYEILKTFNPFCCFVFKRNFIKKENSRKGNSPYWRGTVACKHQDVVAQLTIQDRDKNILKIEFFGDVKHDNKAKSRKNGWGATCNSSARIRTKKMLCHQNTTGINSLNFHPNHFKLATVLALSKEREDEKNAMELGHMWRKLFGYIQHFNLTNNINLVLFNEASVRLYHELANYDTVYIDATGKLFSDEGLHERGRLLYYAMVMRHPYPKFPPIPIVEYITSVHTIDSIRLMLRTLKEKEKEVFPNLSLYTTPALVMADFNMAIINACVREFTGETVQEYLTRGYDIINGDARKEDAEKTIFHVCAAHMLKLNKFHAQKLQEKGKQDSSQIHIANRFFGRLLCCSTLQEMRKFVSLGYYIFQSKYVNPTLETYLDKFSHAIHEFSDPIELDIDEDDDNDDAERLTETLSTPDEENVWITYWNERLSEMGKNEANHGDLNKYFMPKYFAFVSKNYLPSCVLWSRLLLGDLTRFNEQYIARTALNNFNPRQRNYLRGNNTNGQVEDFIGIKKNCSFKGRRNMRLDTFIVENWKDNKGLQRQFVDGLIHSDESCSLNNSSIGKVSLICEDPKMSLRKESILPVEESCSSNEESDVLEPVEEWNKPSTQIKRKHKKGKYLSPSQTKLNFKPVAVKATANARVTKRLDCSSKEFKTFERKVSSDICKKNKSFKTAKKEVKKMWKGLTNKERQNYSSTSSNKAGHRNRKILATTHTGRHCICRQDIGTNESVKCILCQEIFHCRCVKFCPVLASLETSNYVCASFVNIHYAEFLKYVWTKEDQTAIDNDLIMHELSIEFNLKEVGCATNSLSVENKNTDSYSFTHDNKMETLTILHSRGMENKKSNCWLNSILQCLFASPFHGLIHKVHKSYTGKSILLDGLYSCFQEMAKNSNEKDKAPCVWYVNGPLHVAASVGMLPQLNYHQDVNEFLNFILNEMCLASECNVIRGRSFTPWNLLIDIPVHRQSIELSSLIRKLTFGRLSTEEDDICRNCDSKPASHYIELFHNIPLILVITINRANWTGKTRVKITTPVSCGQQINLRGTTTTNYDEVDIIYSLLSAIVHYGASAKQGHFVSYTFHSDQTATLYDDTIVKRCNTNEVLQSQEFLQNVYMCFYTKGDRWPESPDLINYTEKRRDIPWYINESDVRRVVKIWSYQKKVVCNAVTPFDLNTVKPFNWLNGDITNSFLTSICQDSCDNGRNVHAFNSHLYDALRNNFSRSELVHASLAVDPKEFDILMFPVNVASSHWTLLVFYPNSLLNAVLL